MREAFGGSLLMYILFPVLIVFVFFMAFVMRYASTYRASNYVISQIETCDGDLDNCSHSSRTKIANDIKSKYHYNGDMELCYVENSKGTVYRVTLFVDFDVPLIGNLTAYNVTSESKTIYNVHESKKVTGNPINPCNATT